MKLATIMELLDISTLDELEFYLGCTVEVEAHLRNVAPAAVLAERENWLRLSRQSSTFLRMWRRLNAVDLASYCRLTGKTRREAKKYADWAGPPDITLEPITGKVVFSTVVLKQAGYTTAEIDRARKGEQVHLTRPNPGIAERR